MRTPKISIIIPVYNTMDYLDRCVNSCLKQTMDEIEIILVDDASTDNSKLVMRKYEKDNPDKVRCIYLEKNIRQGGARNRALKLATGEYVTFLDSDDALDYLFCEKLYNRAVSTGSKVVYADMKIVKVNGEALYHTRFPETLCGDVKSQIGNLILLQYIGPVACLVKREIFGDERTFFPENTFCEDVANTKTWLLLSNKIEKVYGTYYINFKNETSTETVLKKEFRDDAFKCVRILYDRLSSLGYFENYKSHIKAFCARYIVSNTKNLLRNFEEKTDEIIDKVVELCDELVFNGNDFEVLEKVLLPNELDIVFNKSLNIIETVDDYKCYYLKQKIKIKKALSYFDEIYKNNIFVWSNTVYAQAFFELFDYNIVDDENQLGKHNGCVIALQSAHVANIKHKLYGKNISIFDLQRYILDDENEDVTRFEMKL